MAEYGTLSDYRFVDSESADDIRGAKVYDRQDDKLGKIDDVIFNQSSGNVQYVVVDTGGWLTSKKFIVPPEQLHASSKHEGDFETNLDKARIETFPPYDQKHVQYDERWRAYESEYKKSWVQNPIQHMEGTDRDITPGPRQMPPSPDSIGNRIDPEENIDLQPQRVLPDDTNAIQVETNAVGLGSRWANFEERLRQRHKDIIDASERRSAAMADTAPDLRRAS